MQKHLKPVSSKDKVKQSVSCSWNDISQPAASLSMAEVTWRGTTHTKPMLAFMLLQR
jgi:hypothetical protein